jgi:hypothetical protein
MSSAAVSRAKTCPTPGRAPAYPAPVRDSGGNCFEPFAWFDPDSRSWKTWQLCLVEGWEPFSGTWPRSGLMRNGIAYRRAPLVRLTDAIGCGLLPTPTAQTYGSNRGGSAGRVGPIRYSLEAMAKRGLLPTPTVKGNYNRKGLSSKSGDGLATVVRRWASPAARDFRSGLGRKENGHSKQLPEQVGGTLNPTWVEWLMGFPLGWTALKGSATRSSRKSRK